MMTWTTLERLERRILALDLMTASTASDRNDLIWKLQSDKVFQKKTRVFQLFQY